MTNEQFTVSSCAVNQAPKNPDTRTCRGQLGAGPPPARLHYRGSVTDTAASPLPPQAGRKPAPRTHHGDTFEDRYEWLRAKDDADVIAHLEAENAFTQRSEERRVGKEGVRT